MQAKIKSDDNCESLDQESDSLALTKVIKGIAYKFESQHSLYLALDNAKCLFYAYQQTGEGELLYVEVQEYYWHYCELA